MLEILRLLEKDGRLTEEEIAEMTGKPVEEVCRIISNAKELGIICKYKAVINWERVPEDDVTMALIEVRVSPQREFGFDAIAQRLMGFPEVRSLYLLSGSYDLHVVVSGKDLRDVANFVTTKLATLEAVLSTTTHFVLKRYKVDGDILVDDSVEPERLPMT